MKNVLLVGLGRFGRSVAQELNDLGHDVLALDRREDRINECLDIVTDARIGDSTSEELLVSLGVRDFEVCIVAIGDDFMASLQTTALLHDLGAQMVVARAASDVQEKFLLRNGADAVVYPEKQLARWTAIRFGSDHVLDFIELDGENAIFEIEAPHSWIGRTLAELDVRRRFEINVLGVKRGGSLDVNVNASTRVAMGDALLVLGPRKSVRKCFHI